MRKAIATILLALAFCLQSHAQDSQLQEWQLAAMQEHLRSLMNQSLPERDYLEFPPEQNAGNVPVSLTSMFRSILESVFGNSTAIRIQTCVDCDFITDYQRRMVSLELPKAEATLARYGQENGQTVLEFILAHEISHFITEASVGKGERRDRTINGFPTLFKPLVDDPESNDDMVVREDRKVLAHCEVDAYALLVLKAMGKPKPTAALLLMQQFLEEDLQANNDDSLLHARGVRLRSAQLQSLMNQLWP